MKRGKNKKTLSQIQPQNSNTQAKTHTGRERKAKKRHRRKTHTNIRTNTNTHNLIKLDTLDTISQSKNSHGTKKTKLNIEKRHAHKNNATQS